MLTEDPFSSGDENYVGSRLVSCFTIHDTRASHAVTHDEDSFESKLGYHNTILDVQACMIY